MSNNDLSQIADLLDQKLEEKLDQKFEPIHKELKKHSEILRSLKKDQDTMLKMLDREKMSQSKRLKKVEDHLELTSVIS